MTNLIDPDQVHATFDLDGFMRMRSNKTGKPVTGLLKMAAPDEGELWWQDGVLHREDGPAFIKNGDEQWYVAGQRISDYKNWSNAEKVVFEKNWGDIEKIAAKLRL